MVDRDVKAVRRPVQITVWDMLISGVIGILIGMLIMIGFENFEIGSDIDRLQIACSSCHGIGITLVTEHIPDYDASKDLEARHHARKAARMLVHKVTP